MKTIPVLAIAAALAASGCATHSGGGMFDERRPATEVRRVHAGAIAPASVTVAPPNLAQASDPVIGAYVAAVAGELGRNGFTPVTDISAAQLLATVTVRTGLAEQLAADAPAALRANTILYPGAPATGLTVEIRRRADGLTVWQGRSATTLQPRGDVASLAPELARALFFGFPGESGRTISVR